VAFLSAAPAKGAAATNAMHSATNKVARVLARMLPGFGFPMAIALMLLPLVSSDSIRNESDQKNKPRPKKIS